MQIIIPMSGSGARFQRTGLEMPKPLIDIDGRPMIAHVIDLFPGETDFVFIGRADHLDDPRWGMRETIRHCCPAGVIIAIDPHKFGPVHAVLQAADHIKPDEPVLVSYCDFGAVWDYAGFKRFVDEHKCDGAVVGYTGFHPHMLRNHNYGYVHMGDGRVADIREKQPYSDEPMKEFALAGAYYFRNAGTMLEAMRELARNDDMRIDGEHYVSLAYKFLLARGADIRPFLVEHFMQWGTPEDLRDYNYFAKIFRRPPVLRKRPAHAGLVAMPMAGQGKRFEGLYDEPKPLVHVAGKAMALRALEDLPKTPSVRVVIRRDMPQAKRLITELSREIENIEVVTIDKLSEGQAITALAALDGVPDDATATIAACDAGMIYDAGAFADLLVDKSVDVIVWGARGYPFAARKPESYGWIEADGKSKIRKVAVKVKPADAWRDAIITGTFTFRRAGDYRLAVKRMIERNARVNGEFYIDTVINDAIELGLNCRLFEIESYLGWGSPEELKTYEYWRTCFAHIASRPAATA
jgi:NDP-sugar pyrophosphorylase family protein